MNNKVLVLAVHPDDETLGCGGTLLKHKDNNDEIHLLIATSLDKTHSYYEKKEKEIEQISKLYGFNSVNNLRLKTMRVDEYSMSELVVKISNLIKNIKPNIIYLPFIYDVHSDHRKIFEAAFSCTKSFRYPFLKKIYMMETLSETEFAPNLMNNSFCPNIFIDIAKYIDKKIEIINVYQSEIGKHPFPRSKKNIKALATYRGASCGCEYAESFMLLKEIK